MQFVDDAKFGSSLARFLFKMLGAERGAIGAEINDLGAIGGALGHTRLTCTTAKEVLGCVGHSKLGNGIASNNKFA